MTKTSTLISILFAYFLDRDQLKILELSRPKRGPRSGSLVEETEFQTVPGDDFPSSLIYIYIPCNLIYRFPIKPKGKVHKKKQKKLTNVSFGLTYIHTP